jgi:Na+-transporting methylmalonyl-CoA/oxaloacetate decarboxylase gamma subunit
MVSIVGLSITFIALGVFIGVIYLLKAIFPYKPEAEKVEEGSEETSVISTADGEEVAAAIAAVVYAKEKQTGKPAQSKNPMWTSR